MRHVEALAKAVLHRLAAAAVGTSRWRNGPQRVGGFAVRWLVIPIDGAPLKRDEGAPDNGMMAPPDSEMIPPPCSGMIPPG